MGLCRNVHFWFAHIAHRSVKQSVQVMFFDPIRIDQCNLRYPDSSHSFGDDRSHATEPYNSNF